MSDVVAKREIDKIYAELPSIACQGKCYDSCGPIAMSRVEWQRIIKRKGYEPRATSLTCPLLVSNRCSVYQIRPLICRLWGVAEGMECPWDCKPERYLTKVEAYDFLLRIEAESDPTQREEIQRLRDAIAASPNATTLAEVYWEKPVRTHD